MRIRDWSSDVCSSDLAVQFDQGIVDLAAGESGHQMFDGADGNAGLVRQAGAQPRIRDVVVARGDFGMFPADVAAPEDDAAVRGSRVRSEGRGVGKGWVSTCRSRRSPFHQKKKR